MQKCILIFINVKGILALIMPFWVPVQAHNSGLPCAALQEKWLYSMCKEAEYVPTQTCSCTVFQLSSDWIMHCGCTLLLLRLLSRQKKGKKKKKKKICSRVMWCWLYLPRCLLCQNVTPVFLCTQTQAVYQTCYDGTGFVLSTQQMICDSGCLRALNMHTHCSANVYLIFSGGYFVFSWRFAQTLMEAEYSFVGKQTKQKLHSFSP